jgi:hypothetical protein
MIFPFVDPDVDPDVFLFSLQLYYNPDLESITAPWVLSAVRQLNLRLE